MTETKAEIREERAVSRRTDLAIRMINDLMQRIYVDRTDSAVRASKIDENIADIGGLERTPLVNDVVRWAHFGTPPDRSAQEMLKEPAAPPWRLWREPARDIVSTFLAAIRTENIVCDQLVPE